MKKISTNEFIDRANSVHGGFYTYDRTVYKNTSTKVLITCPIHGDFEQAPNKHISSKQGCPRCSKNAKISTRTFVERSEKIHKNKYDYSSATYATAKTKTTIICPIHGAFEQTPDSHIRGAGCPDCSKNRKKDTDSFVENANRMHNNIYGYSKTLYLRSKNKVTITCPVHGDFEQAPNKHLMGQGCPECSPTWSPDLDSLKESFNNKQTNRYNYDRVTYKDAHTKITITCPVHGDFEQTPNKHMLGQGCPSCWRGKSKEEEELVDFIRSFYNGDIIRNDRSIIHPKELDIVIPDKKLAIEYCGLYWHSDEYRGNLYHRDKMRSCADMGYTLLTIFDSDWYNNRLVVEGIIKNRISNNPKRIYARKCEVGCVSSKEASLFFNANHIQKNLPSKTVMGLYNDGDLVFCMSFGRPRFNKEYEWEILRMATVLGCRVIGGASKLMSAFRKNNKGSIISYCDLRWGAGGVYEKMGFTHIRDSYPNYFYFYNDGKHVLHSRSKFQKHKLQNKLPVFDGTISEVKNMRSNGFYRIFDCGNRVFGVA